MADDYDFTEEKLRDANEPLEGDGKGASEKLPAVHFSGFVVSLAQAAMVNMGEIPDPDTGQINRNLPQARYSIDLIDMLAQKTSGNLTDEEQHLLQSVRSDLKMRFVRGK